MRRGSGSPAEGVAAGQAYSRDGATWVAFAALFGFGILNAALGPALPYLRRAEHLSYVTGALHQVAFAVGGTTAGILATRSSAPRRRTIGAGLTGAGAAGLLLGYGGLLPVTLVAALLISAFGTAAVIRLWALLSDMHRPHRAVAMSEGEIAVSLAGVLTPLVFSICAATYVGWRFSFVVAFLVVVAVAAVAAIRLQDADRPQRPDPNEPEPGMAGVPDLAHQRRTLTTIGAVVGLEFTLSFWAASYLHDDVGIARETSVALVSALYAANLVGRVAASRLAHKLPAVVVLWLSLGTALLGLPILLGAQSVLAAATALAVTGIGIGGTFPLASSLHVEASHRTADQALGQILTVAGVAQITGPFVAGALAEAGGLRLGLLVLPALVLLAAASTRRERRGADA